MKVEEVKCKSIMSDSGLYGVDYSINPYVGCEHDCKYCYATYMRGYTGHSESWGEFVDVKINSRRVLENDLMDKDKGSILLSSVTDPYQPLEEEYELTRNILRRLADTRFPVYILTKGDLITRDLDVLENFKSDRIEVGFTLNFLEESDRKLWEPKSSTVSGRLEALKEVSNRGIDCYLHVGPYFEGITDLSDIRDRTEDYVHEIQVEGVNFRNNVKGIMNVIGKNYPELENKYREIIDNPRSYERRLERKVDELRKSSDLTISLFL